MQLAHFPLINLILQMRFVHKLQKYLFAILIYLLNLRLRACAGDSFIYNLSLLAMIV